MPALGLTKKKKSISDPFGCNTVKHLNSGAQSADRLICRSVNAPSTNWSSGFCSFGFPCDLECRRIAADSCSPREDTEYVSLHCLLKRLRVTDKSLHRLLLREKCTMQDEAQWRIVSSVWCMSVNIIMMQIAFLQLFSFSFLCVLCIARLGVVYPRAIIAK